MPQLMARNQYYDQLKTPVSTWHRSLHNGVSLTDCDFLPICPACAKPLLIADTIYNRDNKFKGKSAWMNKPYKFIARKCEIPFFAIWYTVNEISDKERPITEFNIKRIYPPGKNKIIKLTPDEMLQYLEWKVQQHIPACSDKDYLLKRVTEVNEYNSTFERLENYVKLLSK
jgi:uncharacterized protein YuzB (UPF0349 family)